MTSLVDGSRFVPLGCGQIAPPGSVADPGLSARLGYKRHVAGTYVGISPPDILTRLPPGPLVVSEKLDGEMWFLHHDGAVATLLSPTGRAITGVPLTDEAASLLGNWSGLLAGELYARSNADRPRVFDLHAALGGGAAAQVDRLRFGAFDLLVDREVDAQRTPLADRIARLRSLLQGGQRLHAARFDTADTPSAVAAWFAEIVTRGGAEGLVVHAGDSRIYKVKPEITLDAVVIGYAANENLVSELLLALLTEDGSYQCIGRVRTGWRNDERRALAGHLEACICPSTYRAVTDYGTLLRSVRPEVVVEVRCNDLLASDAKDEAIRRMRVVYTSDGGWSPLGPAPSISLQNGVFLRVRDDKRAVRPDVRFEQVSDLVVVPAESTRWAAAPLPASEIVRREVYSKTTRAGLAVRKLVGWKTNKQKIDSRFPAFVLFVSDHSPGRAQPLQTDLRVASSEAVLHRFADAWLVENVKRGWVAAAIGRQRPEERHDERADPVAPNASGPTAPSVASAPRLTIAFARSGSPTFPVVRKRLDALAPLGTLSITRDARGREAWFELAIERDLVPSARRVENMLSLVRAWKSTQVSLDGEPLAQRECVLLLERLDRVRLCWSRHHDAGAASCRRSCRLGCHALRIEPSLDQLHLRSSSDSEPPWFTVGAFDGQRVHINKAALRAQVGGEANNRVRLCPLFDAADVAARIAALPDAVAPDDTHWMNVYGSDGKPVWVWPSTTRLPWMLSPGPERPGHRPAFLLRFETTPPAASPAPATAPAAAPISTAAPGTPRAVPPTRFCDVVGQDAAVQSVRDLVEVPLRHGDLLRQVGASPQAHGVLLAGPPGTGKTLLARAVAGECGAHVEIVSGPAVLSKWIGESEATLRAIFARARALAPAIVLIDEIDSIAPSRGGPDAEGHASLVGQLLVLLDGIEARGQVYALGTTNRPDDVDPALRRPGRFDQIVWMGAPDERGRLALFQHHLRGLKLAPPLSPPALAGPLAAASAGLSGADIAFACRRAALICVRDAAARRNRPAVGDLAITRDHLYAALAEIAATRDTPAVPALRCAR